MSTVWITYKLKQKLHLRNKYKLKNIYGETVFISGFISYL